MILLQAGNHRRSQARPEQETRHAQPHRKQLKTSARTNLLSSTLASKSSPSVLCSAPNGQRHSSIRQLSTVRFKPGLFAALSAEEKDERSQQLRETG